LSKGNVYHHFPDKETIFRALLDQYFRALSNPDHPFIHALAHGTFPENLEQLGYATRESVERYREYVALIYVDVVEFDGAHIRKFYGEMAERFDAFLKANKMDAAIRGKLSPGLSPTSAVMLATRIFFNYFSIEILFGVLKENPSRSRNVSRA
jgi:AcrR family transcriptional regulator